MSYVIKHPRHGVYTKHELTPRFRRLKNHDEWKLFPTHEAALAALKDLPRLEGCSIEEVKK